MFARSLGLAGIAMLMATACAFAETPGHRDHGSMGQMMSPQQETAGTDDCPMMRGHDMHERQGTQSTTLVGLSSLDAEKGETPAKSTASEDFDMDLEIQAVRTHDFAPPPP